ncbi:MAG: hypothetical protein AAF847_05305 [Bacteroidota bacterium]
MKTNAIVVKKRKKRIKKQKPKPKPKPKRPAWLLVAIFTITMAGTFHEYVIRKSDGSYELSPERQRKLDRELEELEEDAEQYALRAKANEYYPCYNCGNSTTVFLNVGEVWKYGYTLKKNRYSEKYLDDLNLLYDPQFVGSPRACLKEEKRKIFRYPLLPENLVRSFRLPRPPGNKQDN